MPTIGEVEGAPRLEGRNAHIIIAPLKVKKKPEKSTKEKPSQETSADQQSSGAARDASAPSQ